MCTNDSSRRHELPVAHINLGQILQVSRGIQPFVLGRAGREGESVFKDERSKGPCNAVGLSLFGFTTLGGESTWILVRKMLF